MLILAVVVAAARMDGLDLHGVHGDYPSGEHFRENGDE
jgi:hypothetical protein